MEPSLQLSSKESLDEVIETKGVKQEILENTEEIPE